MIVVLCSNLRSKDQLTKSGDGGGSNPPPHADNIMHVIHQFDCLHRPTARLCSCSIVSQTDR